MNAIATVRLWGVLIALSFGLGVVSADAQGANPIKVAYGHSVPIIDASYAPLAAAIWLGFFAKEGLDVTVQTTAGSLDVVQNLIGGQFDIGDALPESVVPAIAQGHDLVMVYNFIRSPTGSLAVLENSPIKSLKDLKGKTIGVSSLGSANVVLSGAQLSEAGLDPKRDVTYVAVGVGAQALHALITGQVDAFALFDSLYAGMENLGTKFRYFKPDPNLFSTQFVVTRKTMTGRPKLVEGFGRAMAKATYFTEIHPEAAIRIMWKTFPTTRSPGVPEAKQLADDMGVLEKRMPLLLTGGVSEHMRWGSYDSTSIERWLDFAVGSGVLKKKPAANVIYSNAFVDEYNNWRPADVQKISSGVQ